MSRCPAIVLPILSFRNAFLYCTYAPYVPLIIVLFDYLVFLSQIQKEKEYSKHKKRTHTTHAHTHIDKQIARKETINIEIGGI